ncbi:MAG: hypothetical protein KGZ58_04570 [Ignavibacteriales bacterium]|nr:hypothetical protein [Ignavibacteriales bacterium]
MFIKQDSKKEIEHNFVKIFLQLMPNIPIGTIIQDENPDILYESTTDLIGIEVTRLHKSDKIKREEAERIYFLNECVKEYEKLGMPPIEVKVFFAWQTTFNKKNRNARAKKLASIVALHIPSEFSGVRVKNDFKTLDVFPAEIHSITIYRFGHKENFWNEAGFGYYQEDVIEILQNRINSKNEKLETYNKRCSLYWLLIVIENEADSTFFLPSKDSLDYHFKSQFDKIFLLNLFGNTVDELNTVSN